MADKNETKQDQNRASLVAVAEKLEWTRKQLGESNAERNRLQSLSIDLQARIDASGKKNESLSSSSSEKISFLQDHVDKNSKDLSAAAAALKNLASETERADSAEALYVSSKSRSDADVLILREQLKDLQTKVFVFREAVKGL